MSNISNLEAVKIQARAVIPIVKALERELGKEKAHKLVGETLAESWAEFTATRQEPGTHPASGADQGFPVERTIVKDTDDVYAVNMTNCKFADYFRRIGEPEIGALITCGVDFAVERRMRPDWTFSRSKTLMQGASHCDFCWSRKR
jgi:hypothetical protein